MLWPWVSRRQVDTLRRAKHIAERELVKEVAIARELRAQLAISQADNKELHLKLLRVGFGLSPFQEALGIPTPAPTPEAPPPSPSDFRVTSAMSPEQIQQTFALEGAQKYGNNMRAIMAHIEKRQAEYYGVGNQPSVLTEEEARQARAVHADLMASISEGQRNAGKAV